MTLGPFLGFLCYVLGTKLDSVLPLRMRHKGMQLVLGRFAGHKTERSQFYRSLKLKSQLCLAGSLATKLKSLNFIQFYSRVSEVTLDPFWGAFVAFWARY